MTAMALEGVRVLDLTHHVAGPYCTKLLADYGAEVIKIEKPGEGDVARRLGPFPHDEPDPERSGLFLHLNTSKRGITLNLKSQQGKAIFRELVKRADILVESFAPRVMPSLGLAYAALREINPNLVMASITSFGQTGPYRDFLASEIVVYAMGGDMHCRGLADREPVKLFDNTPLYQAGNMAGVATMGAFYGARYGGLGQHVDVSIMEALAGGTDMRSAMLLGYQYTGELTPRGPGLGGGWGGIWPCGDGYFWLSAGGKKQPIIFRMIGQEQENQNPKWFTPTAAADPDLKDEYLALLFAWASERGKREISTLGESLDLVSLPMNTIEDLLTDPHFRERGYWTEVEHPRAGKLEYTGRAFLMSQTPGGVQRPAPLLGQHNGEVLGELGYGPQDLVRFRGMGVI